MYAIEIKDLKKSFKGMYDLDGVNTCITLSLIGGLLFSVGLGIISNKILSKTSLV